MYSCLIPKKLGLNCLALIRLAVNHLNVQKSHKEHQRECPDVFEVCSCLWRIWAKVVCWFLSGNLRQTAFVLLFASQTVVLFFFLFLCFFKCSCLMCLSRLWESLHIFGRWAQRNSYVVDSFSVLTNVLNPMLDFTFCTTLGESFVWWFFLKCLVNFCSR